MSKTTNYYILDDWHPFTYEVVFWDTKTNIVTTLLTENKIKYKGLGYFTDTQPHLILKNGKIKKRDKDKFERLMGEAHKKLMVIFGSNYLDKVNMFNHIIQGAKYEFH